MRNNNYYYWYYNNSAANNKSIIAKDHHNFIKYNNWLYRVAPKMAHFDLYTLTSSNIDQFLNFSLSELGEHL